LSVCVFVGVRVVGVRVVGVRVCVCVGVRVNMPAAR
jgi:hypothetical protein